MVPLILNQSEYELMDIFLSGHRGEPAAHGGDPRLLRVRRPQELCPRREMEGGREGNIIYVFVRVYKN